MLSYSRLLVFILIGLLYPLILYADWNGCADDLDSLRRAASYASDTANKVKSKADDFENCKQFPDIYDLMRDRCQSKAYDYQRALSDLESELNTVNNRVRSVSSSCRLDLSSVGTPQYAVPIFPSSGDYICQVYREYKNKLPLKTLMKACTNSMSEAECRNCLGK